MKLDPHRVSLIDQDVGTLWDELWCREAPCLLVRIILYSVGALIIFIVFWVITNVRKTWGKKTFYILGDTFVVKKEFWSCSLRRLDGRERPIKLIYEIVCGIQSVSENMRNTDNLHQIHQKVFQIYWKLPIPWWHTVALPAIRPHVERSVNIAVSVTPLIIHQLKLNYLLKIMKLGSHGFCNVKCLYHIYTLFVGKKFLL